MNFKFTHPSISRAALASDQANRGHLKKLARNRERDILAEYSRLMASAPVVTVTLIFLVVFGVDLEVSWELYRVLVSYVFPQQQPGWAVVSIGFFIAGWTGYVSHCFAKPIQHALRDIEIYHIIGLIHNGLYPRLKAEEEVRAGQKREIYIGIFLGSILLALVTLISFQRSFLIAEIQGVANSGMSSIVQKVLPVLLAVLGIITGIYLQYIWWLLKRQMKAGWFNRQFNKFLGLVRQSDGIVNELYMYAQQNGEIIQRTKPLFDSLFRFRSRAIDENYLDPIPVSFREVPVTVISEAGTPLANITIFGLTANNQLTASYVTLPDGSATVSWQDNSESLSQLVVNGLEHPGTYYPYQPTVIKLSRLNGQSGSELLN